MNDKRLVMVEWVDALGCSALWTDVNDINTKPVICKSVGWLLHDDGEVVVIVPHFTQEDHDTSEFQCCGDMTIPRVAIKTMVELRAGVENPSPSCEELMVIGILLTVHVMTMTNMDRELQNERLLKLMSPSIRGNVAAVIKDMEDCGYQPVIHPGVYRTPAQQAEKVRQGVSKVSYSYHNVTDKDGTPASLAADILDVRDMVSWNPSKKYSLQYAAACERQGLQTGIYFGLNRSQKNAVHKAIADHDYDANVAVGWDVAHCQPWQWRWPLWAVKRGVRPKIAPPKRGLFGAPILVVNGHVIKGAYILHGHWYCIGSELAEAVGQPTHYPGSVVPVASQLKQWKYAYVTNDRRASMGRFDIRITGVAQ